MNRDLVAPLDTDPEAFPCPTCGGAGTVPFGGFRPNCVDCGGSGYGPPPPALDKAVEHCLCRLHKWAHRALPNTEEN